MASSFHATQAHLHAAATLVGDVLTGGCATSRMLAVCCSVNGLTLYIRKRLLKSTLLGSAYASCWQQTTHKHLKHRLQQHTPQQCQPVDVCMPAAAIAGSVGHSVPIAFSIKSCVACSSTRMQHSWHLQLFQLLPASSIAYQNSSSASSSSTRTNRAPTPAMG
jgi:hypothetical protein